MFREYIKANHVEGSSVTDGVLVREKISQAERINPQLLAETERLNAGKVIDIAELDKPITSTEKKEMRILSFAKPEQVTKELRDEILAQVEAMRVSPLRPFETQEERDAVAARLASKVERAYEDRLFNSMVFAQDDLIHVNSFGV
jgi:hypothetical protein